MVRGEIGRPETDEVQEVDPDRFVGRHRGDQEDDHAQRTLRRRQKRIEGRADLAAVDPDQRRGKVDEGEGNRERRQQRADHARVGLGA